MHRGFTFAMLVAVVSGCGFPVCAQTNCPPGTIPIWTSQGQGIQLGCSKTDLRSLLQSVGDLQQVVQDLKKTIAELNAQIKKQQTQKANQKGKQALGNDQKPDMPEKDIKEIQNEVLDGSGTVGTVALWKNHSTTDPRRHRCQPARPWPKERVAPRSRGVFQCPRRTARSSANGS